MSNDEMLLAGKCFDHVAPRHQSQVNILINLRFETYPLHIQILSVEFVEDANELWKQERHRVLW